MKFALKIIVFSLVLAGCSRSDDKFSKQIVGKWKDSKGGNIVYAPDGSFNITKSRGTNIYWFTGLWQIKDGILNDTITNAYKTNLPWMGLELQYHIRELNGHHLEIEEASPIIKYTR